MDKNTLAYYKTMRRHKNIFKNELLNNMVKYSITLFDIHIKMYSRIFQLK